MMADNQSALGHERYYGSRPGADSFTEVLSLFLFDVHGRFDLDND